MSNTRSRPIATGSWSLWFSLHTVFDLFDSWCLGFNDSIIHWFIIRRTLVGSKKQILNDSLNPYFLDSLIHRFSDSMTYSISNLSWWYWRDRSSRDQQWVWDDVILIALLDTNVLPASVLCWIRWRHRDHDLWRGKYLDICRRGVGSIHSAVLICSSLPRFDLWILSTALLSRA